MKKPIVHDLFCGGSGKPKFFGFTNSTIQQSVACRAKYPNHMSLRVGSKPPRAIALERWPMCYLKNPCLAAGLAGAWHFQPSAGQPVKSHVFEFAILFIEWAPLLILAFCPLATKFTGHGIRTLHRAIALIGIRWNDSKMFSASTTVSSIFRRAFVFLAADSTSSRRAIIAAPFFIGFSSREESAAELTVQFIHRKIIT
jgi:hypothetical protein